MPAKQKPSQKLTAKEIEEAYRKAKKADRRNIFKRFIGTKIERAILKARFAKIHEQIVNFLKKNNLSLDNVVFVGVDRGGRIPALAVKKALNLKSIQFIRFSSRKETAEESYILRAAKKGKWKGKTILLIDSTANVGYQKETMKKFFNEYGEKIGIKGWKLIANGVHADWKIEWGFEREKYRSWRYFFEDAENIIGLREKETGAKVCSLHKTGHSVTDYVRKEVKQPRKILLKKEK
jgi:hypoxanthine phosphoribosyltransferase